MRILIIIKNVIDINNISNININNNNGNNININNHKPC